MNAMHERLRAVLAREPRLKFAILFGSQARCTARPDSDIDIAIASTAELSSQEEGQLATDLELAAGRPVDLVRITDATPALRWRIARDGVILLSTPEREAVRFIARVGIEHDEQSELRHDAMRRFRSHVATGISR